MKKAVFASVVLLIISFNSFSQEKFTTYKNTYIEGEYDISLSFNDDGEFSLYIKALSVDTRVSNGGFILDESKYDSFILNLIEAQKKYEEWVETAKANDVIDLDKDIKIEAENLQGYFLYGSSWRFDFSITPSYRFFIKEKEGIVNYVLIVGSGELVASDNDYIDCNGFVLIFTSVEEIDTFMNLISIEKINEFQNKPKKEDLFKD